MVTEYDRWDGVPEEHGALMRILCFGEQGGHPYEDKIIVHALTAEEIKEYCEAEGITLDDPNGWSEYFIQER